MDAINSNKEIAHIKDNITGIINRYNAKLIDCLSPSTIHHLATHLTIAVIRIQSKNYIPLSISQIASILDHKIVEHAKNICQEIQQECNIVIPEGEVAVISMYLSKSRLLDVEIKSGYDLLDKEVFDILNNAMSDIYKVYDFDFRYNDNLWIAMGLHLISAIERLQNHKMIENPLTNNIKKENSLAFSLANIVNSTIEKQYNASLSEDEVAFIAIHFLDAIKEYGK